MSTHKVISKGESAKLSSLFVYRNKAVSVFDAWVCSRSSENNKLTAVLYCRKYACKIYIRKCQINGIIFLGFVTQNLYF
jgi:hypothetical protein